MKAATLTLLCLTALATQAQASSPDAWAAYDKTVLASCTKASGLKNANPVGNAAQFDDRVGYTALLLQGQYPQKTHERRARHRAVSLQQKKQNRVCHRMGLDLPRRQGTVNGA